MAARAQNPAVSPEQYRLAQAVLSGTARDSHMPVSVAREIVDRTPKELRSEWSRNPVTMTRELAWAAATDAGNRNMRLHGRSKWSKEDFNVAAREFARLWPQENPSYGMDLDLETSMAPAWMYYESKEARDQAARVWEGQGKKIIKEHSFFGYKQAGGKKWRLRAANQMGNPKKRPSDVDGNPVPQNYEMLSIRRNQGDALDVKKGLALENIPSVIVEPPNTTFGVSTGNWSVWTPKKTYKRAVRLAEKAYFDRHPERLSSNPSKSFGGNVHEQLLHAATQYDMKEEATAAKRRAAGKQGYHNIYALPQYLGRIEEVEKDIASGTPVRKAITDGFTGRLLDAMLKAVGEPRSTKEEQKGGAWTYKGNPGDFYQKTMHDNAYHEIGEIVNNSVFGPVQITARRETNDPEKYKYEYDITTVTSTGRTRRSKRPYGPGPGKRYRGNPEGASEEMFESFHGEPSDETIEYTQEEHYHSNLPALGELVELKVKLVNGDKAVIGFEAGSGDQTDNPFWPFNSFTKTTIYHVGTGEKYKKSGSFKGYTLYQKIDTGEFLVPALDKDSRFDTSKDAKAFINAWTKHQKNPLSVKVIGGKYSEADAKAQKLADKTGQPVSVLQQFTKHSKSGRAKKGWTTTHTVYPSKSNPGGPLDEHAAKELELYVENDSDLYRQQYTPINKNLITKMARGVYNHTLAVKLFGYLMESGAKKYAKEYSEGKDWHQIFSPATRKHVAELFTNHFETEAKLGNYDSLLPKKYQKKNPRGKKGHGGPFREAGKLVSGITSGASRPMDDFIVAAGKVGGYLDDQIGRVLNPNTQDTGPTRLCSNEDGTQLFFIGGDQSVDLNALGITGPEAQKENVNIGHVTHITYHTRKLFKNKPEEYDYIHKFSEDSHGPLPVLNYDRINKQLQLSGGMYKIEKPLLGTSPGIED